MIQIDWKKKKTIRKALTEGTIGWGGSTGMLHMVFFDIPAKVFYWTSVTVSAPCFQVNLKGKYWYKEYHKGYKMLVILESG